MIGRILKQTVIWSTLTLFVFLPLTVEFVVTILQPLGIRDYSGDLAELRHRYIYLTPDLYTLPVSSAIDLYADWRVTMDDEIGRAMPDRNSDCLIAFIGDSVTFGHGVNDDETFARLIAEELGVSAINFGMNGYNAEQVLASIEYLDGRYDIDLYVYLHTRNDHHEAIPESDMRHGGWQPAFVTTVLYLNKSRRLSNVEIPDWYHSAIDAITSRDNVLMFAFDNDEIVPRESGAIILDSYTPNVNSPADGHPNTQGHRMVAYQMLPDIRNALRGRCD